MEPFSGVEGVTPEQLEEIRKMEPFFWCGVTPEQLEEIRKMEPFSGVE